MISKCSRPDLVRRASRDRESHWRSYMGLSPGIVKTFAQTAADSVAAILNEVLFN